MNGKADDEMNYCERCVYGTGEHLPECTDFWTSLRRELERSTKFHVKSLKLSIFNKS